jgi:putative intracellular protease/amidase
MWKKIAKGLIASLVGVIAILVIATIWFINLLDPEIDIDQLKASNPKDISYIRETLAPPRGKILAVVTSTSRIGNKKTGYELTELARAYYVFQSNGYEVDIASPLGGKSPAILDDDDMGEFDYAFLNDANAINKIDNTIPLAEIHEDQYQAIYFVGGKGAMLDFPNNPSIHKLVVAFHQQSKPIIAVCHGPAALTQIKLSDGSALVNQKRISAFTNEEELFLIRNARELFPFLLEDELRKQGAIIERGPRYLQQISHHDNLITGQNPWSVWAMADASIQQLGFQPVARKRTSEENSVDILGFYEKYGYEKTKIYIQKFSGTTIKRDLIAMHALVAAMSYQPAKVIDLLGLMRVAKAQASDQAS